MQPPTKDTNEQTEEYLCVFYNAPLEWNKIIRCYNLKVLTIVGQTITNIDGVNLLTQLEELWVIESALQNADAALKCDNLKKLYLYSNKLSEIPYVFVLKYLKVLWLSENNISVINNIVQSDELNELNLASNNITEIGNGLLKCTNLEYLNLAGNPISNLLGISDLKSVSSLRKLLFYDANYRTTPITQYVNYRSYVIKILPQLTSLDDFTIYPEECLAVANYYASKDLYYSIQYHSELYKFSEEIIRKKKLQLNKLNTIQDRIFNGEMMLKKKTKSFLDKYHIDEEVKKVKKELRSLNLNSEIGMEKYRSDLELKYEKLQLEQNYFGNVKLIDINDNKNIMKLLQNVLKLSVCPSLTRYVSTKVIQAFQIIDRRTLLKGINCLIGISNDICSEEMNFFILNEPLGVQDTFAAHFEFLNGHLQSKKLSLNKYTVTNSTAIADSQFFNQMDDDSEFNRHESSRILMLVYTLKNSKPTDSGNHTIFVNSHLGCKCCVQNKITWNAIVPVFVVEYQYKTKLVEDNEEYLDLSFLFGSSEDSASEFTIAQSTFQENSVRSFRNVDRHLPLDYKCVQYCNKFEVNSWCNLTSLDLTRSCISSFGSLSQYPKVMHLNVSYNKISSLFEISVIFPNLISLIASYNLIKSVKSMSEMNSLTELDLSSNQIGRFLSSLGALKKTLKGLSKLKLDYNPFIDVQNTDHMPLIAKRCYPSLISFNDRVYSKHEITSKVLKIDSFKGFKQYIIPNNMTLERNSGKVWNRDNCNEFMKHEESTENKENFYNIESHVTVEDCVHDPLCLYICNCEQVYCSIMLNSDTSSLRYLTVTRTYINSLTINNVSNLEELDISFNMIISLNKISFSSEKLVRLNLMGNYLICLDFFNEVSLPSLKNPNLKQFTLERIQNYNCIKISFLLIVKKRNKTYCYTSDLRHFLYLFLKYINVSRNFIQCFRGIDKFITLEEVHLTLNLMTDWNEIKILRKCTNLKVIDIRGNPVDDMKMVKTFLTFNLHHLKYLNGEIISESDLEEASSFFKGILDKDYLLKEHSQEKLSSLTELTVVNCSVKQVMLPVMKNLTSLNLEHNNLTSFSCLVHLRNLKCLCLSNNHITCFGECPQGRLFNNLEVLYLNMNNIKNLEDLELNRAPKLISLFLQDNELINIQGLNDLENLKHLVLDRNKIRCIGTSEVSDLTSLKNLYLEYNQVHCLNFLKELKELKSLFLAFNKINKYETLQNLNFTRRVKEFTFYGNPLCRYASHYEALLSFLPNLNVLDGILLDRNKLQF